MDWLTPWIALGISAALLLARSSPADASSPDPRSELKSAGRWLGILIILGVIGISLGLWMTKTLGSSTQLVFGLGLGFLASAVAAAMSAYVASDGFRPILGCGLATTMLGLCQTDSKGALIALAASAAACCSGLWMSLDSPRIARTIKEFALVGSFGGCLLLLGGKSGGVHGEMTSPIIGLAVVVAATMVQGLRQAGRIKQQGIAIGLFGVLTLIAVWLIAKRYLFLADVGWLGTMAMAATLLSTWVQPDNSSSRFRSLLLSTIWITMATLAFGMLRGYGMGVVAFVGAVGLVASGNGRLLGQWGPIGALVLYRVLRELNPDASKAFDIGQHYAILGILIGVMFVLAPIEFWVTRKSEKSGGRTAAAVALAVLLVGAQTGALLLLGSKGATGLMIGLGLGAFFASMAGSSARTSMSIGIGLGSLLVVGYGTMAPYLDLARSEKMVWVMWIVGSVVVLAALVRLLAGREMKESAQ